MIAIAESLIAVITQVMAVILEHAYVPCPLAGVSPICPKRRDAWPWCRMMTANEKNGKRQAKPAPGDRARQ